MSSTIILVTGSNTGLGLETVKSLFRSQSHAYTVLLGGRDLSKAKTAAETVKKEYPDSKSNVVPVQIDLEDDASIKALGERVQTEFGRLDCLVNNAGGQFDQQYYKGNMTMREVWNKSWDVNVTGTQVLTHTLIPLILKSADPRILFITSGTATLAETTNMAIPVNKAPDVKGWPKNPANPMAMGVPAYRSAKTGLNMMMREWLRILTEDGVKCWSVSPGLLATGLGGSGEEFLKKMGALEPSVGADFVRDVVEGKRDADVGMAVRNPGKQAWSTTNVQPW